ncbi:DNA repair protein RecO [Sulfurirhabdus autotrophica]|uniref:DNA repair protein RecO n=1 Tax=Sulfurirhabdus autotrophica TaxID=1706046 RepID=A0A4R3YDM8_9PROT|nr:DNA repair protein RecO [Sulfurirhabdus autotrophica]TCV90227.1 DNA replication and repair protein RecO [Sulfurirhabdus autotrophica]
MGNTQKSQQEAQPAYVLHSYPFRETSLIVEVFSRNFGRLAIVARGARRPKSAVRGLLMAFQPLQLNWFGKAELKTLHSAEWQGGQPQLQGMALLCGFYLNELMLKLLHRDDPHENLFMYYQETLQSLASQRDYAAVLRRFEIRLLQELGYALTFVNDVSSGESIVPDREYHYQIEYGPVVAEGRNSHQIGVQLSGKTLLDMAADNYRDPLTLQQSKTLMRTLINHYLGDQTLHTRQLLKDMQQS